MSVDTDQETVDRWLAAGRWEQFAPGWLRPDRPSAQAVMIPEPPLDWEPQPCEKCQGTGQGRLLVDFGNGGPIPKCFDCWGSGIQRLAVTVPCCHSVATCRDPSRPHCAWRTDGTADGRITVAWATVEWGPLPVIAQAAPEPATSYVVVMRNDVWLISFGDEPFQEFALPPGVDPASLIGQFARGGSIESTNKENTP